MNSRLLKILCIFTLAFVGVNSYGQLKIAVVNATQAIFESEEAQEEMTVTQAELKPEQERLQGLQEEITELTDRLQTDAEIMSDLEKSELQNEIDDKKLDLNFNVERFQRRIDDERNKILQQLGPKFNAVLGDLIDIEGYDLVVNFNPQIHLYVNPKHDITRKVTEMLNDRQGEPVPDPTADTLEAEAEE